MGELDDAVRAEAEQRPEVRLLMTHPGVGPVVGLAYVLTIGPTARFERGKKVASYLGLIPGEHSSGGRQSFGPISKQGNTMMRTLLVEAAQTAARFDEELRRAYGRLRAKKHSAPAKVMVARKLAVRMYWMLRENKSYAELYARRPVLSGHPASLNGRGVRSSESWSPYEAEEMDGGATEATERFAETSLGFGKSKRL